MIYVYHSSTSSGRFAAYVVWRVLAEKKDKKPVEFIEIKKGESFIPDLTKFKADDSIYLLDLDQPVQDFRDLNNHVWHLLVVGQKHSKDPQSKEIWDIGHPRISAALSIWDHFFGTSNVPRVCLLINHYRNLGMDPDCVPLEAWLQKENISHEWFRWNQLCRHPDVLPNAIEEGKLLLQQKENKNAV